VDSIIHKDSAMTEKEQNIRIKIAAELLKQFPHLNPKIAVLTDNSFTYELEKHGNFIYYIVRYNKSDSGVLTIDWGKAELTVI
jgi:hypothetical protein